MRQDGIPVAKSWIRVDSKRAIGTCNFYIKTLGSEYKNSQISVYLYLTAEAPAPCF